MVNFRKEPIAVPNEVLIYKMSVHASKFVKVLLSGEGADELFYGYDRIFKWANKNNYDTGIDLWDLDDITNWVMNKKEPSKMSLKIPSLSNPSMI